MASFLAVGSQSNGPKSTALKELGPSPPFPFASSLLSAVVFVTVVLPRQSSAATARSRERSIKRQRERDRERERENKSLLGKILGALATWILTRYVCEAERFMQ